VFSILTAFGYNPIYLEYLTLHAGIHALVDTIRAGDRLRRAGILIIAVLICAISIGDVLVDPFVKHAVVPRVGGVASWDLIPIS
jgi:hypothetical protein